VNRQIGVADSKNVIVFDPLFTGHVIRRMRSGRIRIFNGNQWKTQSWPRDPPCMTAVQGQKVKGQGHEVTRRINRQKRYNSAVCGHIHFELGGNYRRGDRRVWYTF